MTEARPRYGGRSLPNLAATICRLLGAEPPDGTPELEAGLLPPGMLAGVNAVLLLVMDGLGAHQLEALARAGEVPVLASLLEAARRGEAGVVYCRLTTVFPSATMAALSSLHTGLPPTRHGIMGWTCYLEELGQVVEIARFGPLDRRGTFADPALGGLDPVAFYALPTIYRRLERVGVRSIGIGPSELQGSPFSVAILDGAESWPYIAPSSTLVLAERALGGRGPGEKRMVYAYQSAVDSLSHRAGPNSQEHEAEAAVLDFTLGRWLTRTKRRGDVLFLLTADHGHLWTDPAQTVRLDHHPELTAELIAPPAGERRMAYLHTRPGRAEAVLAYVRERLADQVEAVPTPEAFASGLFGPGDPTPEARRRAGDVVLLPVGGHQLVFAHDASRPVTPFYGNHGALSPEELDVPLLALRL